jgi:hypothetical protein
MVAFSEWLSIWKVICPKYFPFEKTPFLIENPFAKAKVAAIFG